MQLSHQSNTYCAPCVALGAGDRSKQGETEEFHVDLLPLPPTSAFAGRTQKLRKKTVVAWRELIEDSMDVKGFLNMLNKPS